MTGFWLGTVASSLSSATAEASFDDLFRFSRSPDDDFSLPLEFTPVGIFFKDDGTRVYVLNFSKQIYEYSLSTAWDISTASYTSVSTTLGMQDTPNDLYIDSSGTRIFVAGNSGKVAKHTVSTAWDITSLSATADQLVTFADIDNNWNALTFSPDGAQIYAGSTNSITVNSTNYVDPIVSAPLSTAWDLSTIGSHNAVSLSDLMNLENRFPVGMVFVEDGSKLIVSELRGDQLVQCNLSTAYDITTASYSRAIDLGSEIAQFGGMAISEGNLAEIYVADRGVDLIAQISQSYSTPTIPLSDSVGMTDSISSPSFAQALTYESSVTSQALDGSTTSTLTLSLSTASVGDLCVLWDSRRNETSTSVPTSNTPSGWTLIGTSSGNYGNEFRSDYLYKVLTSSDITNGVTGGQAEDRYMRAYIFSYGTISTVTARDFTTQSTIGDQSLQTQNISTLSSSAPVVCFGFKMTYGGTQTASFVEPTWGTEFTSSGFGNGALASGFTIQNDTLSDIDVDANDQGNAQELTSFHLEIS